MGFSPRDTDPFKRRKARRAPFERRIIRSSLWLAIPGLVTSGVLIWLQDWAIESKLALLFAELVVCALIVAALHDQIIRPLQTLANVVGALREEDYSFRARMAVPDDALGELSLEVNMLADLLAEHRIGAIEATALLQRVVEEVDIPLFAFDPGEALRLVNSAGERLLQQASPRLLGRTAAELGLKTCLSAENASVIPSALRQRRALVFAAKCFPAAGSAAYPGRALRCEPGAAGRRASCLAASDSCHGP